MGKTKTKTGGAWRIVQTPLIFSLVVLWSACGSSSSPLPVFNLDGPSDIAFACYGGLRVDGNDGFSAQPLASCEMWSAGETPDGQEDIAPPSFQGFVLQPARGTVAVVQVDALAVVDNDRLTPGGNDIAVGALPVGIVEDASGCYVMTANSGSCDLSSIDVSSAVDRTRTAEVFRISITKPNGERFLAKPSNIVSGPQESEIGQACPLAPSGKVYVSFADCKMVAAVDAASGMVQSAVVFRDDGSVELATDEDYAACDARCGDSVIAPTSANTAEAVLGFDGSAGDRPLNVAVSADGATLYISRASSPLFTLVPLDETGVPMEGAQQIPLEGEVGILKFSVSGRIEMGGDELSIPTVDPIGEFSFAYLIATDSTVRVLDLDNARECDTQVDPRYLTGEQDVAFLSCMPVGDERTPPRRAGARSPGIHFPIANNRSGLNNLALPLDVSFATVVGDDENVSEVSPFSLSGTFAFVTVASGQVYVVNVDDNFYADYENPLSPALVSIPLAIAHQVRDSVFDRTRSASRASCTEPVEMNDQLAPRLASSVERSFLASQTAESKLHELPFLQGVLCESEPDEAGTVTQSVVSELSFVADSEIRERSFPDLRVIENQVWSVRWEGGLSNDISEVVVDGPAVRRGIAKRNNGAFVLQDSSDSFCRIGTESFDIVSLVGCNPIFGNSDCGTDESCYVHPDSTGGVSSGVCVHTDQIDALSGVCKDFYVSKRRYSVTRSTKSELALIERRRILRTSPLDGCVSDMQCENLHQQEFLLSSEDHPIEAQAPDDLPLYSWVCEADPSRVPGVDRCVMSCVENSDCEDAFHCSSGRCVEAPLPPAECLQTVQQYQVLGGEAFVVLGSDDGYMHSVVADEMSGECVQNPTEHLLTRGRIPLRADLCDDDDDINTGPNPCATTVETVERYIPHVVENGMCVPQESIVATRQASAIRFSNPALTFHMTAMETQGDLQCKNDRAGDGPAFSTVYSGYQISFDVGGGFVPLSVPGLRASLPIRIVRGPGGTLWVIDQGNSDLVTDGRVFRFNPISGGSGSVAIIR